MKGYHQAIHDLIKIRRLDDPPRPNDFRRSREGGEGSEESDGSRRGGGSSSVSDDRSAAFATALGQVERANRSLKRKVEELELQVAMKDAQLRATIRRAHGLPNEPEKPAEKPENPGETGSKGGAPGLAGKAAAIFLAFLLSALSMGFASIDPRFLKSVRSREKSSETAVARELRPASNRPIEPDFRASSRSKPGCLSPFPSVRRSF